MVDHFDLVILGSGSTAFAAALTAQELGKTAVMTEERTIGGTCVNRGCLPSKNLIEATKLLYEARQPRYPGLTQGAMPLDFVALVAQKDAVLRDYRGKKYESLLGGQMHIATGHVEFVDTHTVAVGGSQLRGHTVLIATGSRPVLPAIAGLEHVPYLTSDLPTSDEPMELRELSTSLLIVGGGYIALELGQMFQRFGTEVTLFERSQQLLARGYEPEAGRALEQILTEEGIQVMMIAVVTRVRLCWRISMHRSSSRFLVCAGSNSINHLQSKRLYHHRRFIQGISRCPCSPRIPMLSPNRLPVLPKPPFPKAPSASSCTIIWGRFFRTRTLRHSFPAVVNLRRRRFDWHW
jgi:pyruvate/2-oxoglutarate dehydrogenase complex dihydrolipoamide dehydrogenase (E3) component